MNNAMTATATLHGAQPHESLQELLTGNMAAFSGHMSEPLVEEGVDEQPAAWTLGTVAHTFGPITNARTGTRGAQRAAVLPPAAMLPADIDDLTSLVHVNVVQLIGLTRQPELGLCLVTELLPLSLHAAIHMSPGDTMGNRQRAGLCAGIAFGVDYLHSRGLGNLHLCPQIVMLTLSLIPKIIAFPHALVSDDDLERLAAPYCVSAVMYSWSMLTHCTGT